MDYYLAHLFPSLPGADILRVNNSDPAAVEALPVRNDDGSVVVMLVNCQVRSSADNNGPGVPRTVMLDVSALGSFASATQVSIDATTDATRGPVHIELAAAPQMQLTLNGYGVTFLRFNGAKPQFAPTGVVNAASYQGSGVSPGEIVAIFGTALGPATLAGAQISSPHFLDNTLAGARVYFDGISAPLVYSSARQMSAIVPYEVAGKASTQLQVEYLGALSDPVTVPVAVAVPGLFTKDFSGTGQGSILNQDESPNTAANPAARGSFVSLYATGEGETNPGGIAGMVGGEKLPKPRLPVTATIGGVSAEVTYAGGASGLVAGAMQIYVRVPASIPPGRATPVQISVGNASSQAGVTLAVQ